MKLMSAQVVNDIVGYESIYIKKKKEQAVLYISKPGTEPANTWSFSVFFFLLTFIGV